MASSSQIETYCRIRPSGRRTRNNYRVEPLDRQLTFSVPRLDVHGPNNQREQFGFKFTDIFDYDVKQDEVFEKVSRKAVLNAVDGYNSTVFAYGQTGSGKTFTITGGPERYEDRGIIPRSLSLLFSEFAKRTDYIYTAHISYLEIYNETGYDLLNPQKEASALEDLPQVVLQENEEGNILLKNLTAHQATTEEEALNLLFLGDTTRMIAETPQNEASSRSHCIFTVTITAHQEGSDVVRHSKLHLVDLAGSERVGQTGAQGRLLTEAKYINLSLLHLELVILALHERKRRGRSHIPYRNSMMTSVLRDSLGGNCKTVMVATLSMDPECLYESISTCRFAQRVGMISNQARINEQLSPEIVIRRLKAELRLAKQELALATGQDPDRGPITQGEIDRCQTAVKRYVADDAPDAEIPFVQMILIHRCFLIFKQWIRRLSAAPGAAAAAADRASSVPALPASGPDPPPASSSDPKLAAKLAKLKSTLKQRDAEIEILMGMVERAQAAGGGDAGSGGGRPASTVSAAVQTLRVDDGKGRVLIPQRLPRSLSSSPRSSSSRPSSAASSRRGMSAGSDKENGGRLRRSRGSLASVGGSSSGAPLTREEAFEAFKAAYPHAADVAENQALLRAKYAEAKQLGVAVSQSRENINAMKALIEQLRVERAMQGLLAGGAGGPSDRGGGGAGTGVGDAQGTPDVDPEEQARKAAIEREKKAYKTAFYKLRDLKKEIEHLQLIMERTRVKMAKDFEVFYLSQQSQSTVPSTTTSTATATATATATSTTTTTTADGPSAPGIPLTGNAEADAEIRRFEEARRRLLASQGLGE